MKNERLFIIGVIVLVLSFIGFGIWYDSTFPNRHPELAPISAYDQNQAKQITALESYILQEKCEKKGGEIHIGTIEPGYYSLPNGKIQWEEYVGGDVKNWCMIRVSRGGKFDFDGYKANGLNFELYQIKSF